VAVVCQVDAGLEKTRQSPEKTRVGSVSGAQSGAVGAKLHDLAGSGLDQVIKAWPSLAKADRDRILAIVNAEGR
jgi:hypothetical protein